MTGKQGVLWHHKGMAAYLNEKFKGYFTKDRKLLISGQINRKYRVWRGSAVDSLALLDLDYLV